MKDGIVFDAPASPAAAIWGFVAGLVPPIAGWLWQLAQPFELNRGPRPTPGSPATPPDTE
jgi:hypothetical protein